MFKYAIVSLMLLSASCSLPYLAPQDNPQAIAYAKKGGYQLVKGDLRSAEAFFRLANETADTAEAYDGLGVVAFRREQFAEAERYFKIAYKFDPRYVNALANLGILRHRQGLLTEAEQLYKEALAADPQNLPARNNLAVLLSDTGRLNKAQLEIAKAKIVLPLDIVVRNEKRFSRLAANKDRVNSGSTELNGSGK